jgi:DNA-directed RNA polymerase II subunit RPB2
VRNLLVSVQVELPEDTTGAQRHTKRDASLALRPAEAGVVDQVLLTQNEQGQSFVKVRVRTICIPQVRRGAGRAAGVGGVGVGDTSRWLG